ncbi:hypothetical protein D3C73_1494550 [compost metagenome]
MDTPAMPMEAGKSLTDAPRVIPPEPVRGSFCSSRYLKDVIMIPPHIKLGLHVKS